MFTGIVEAMGEVVEIDSSGSAHRLTVAAPVLADGVAVGDSVAVNGVCLTAVRIEDDRMTVEVVPETLRRTNLGSLEIGGAVNVERSLPADGRFGGHVVQGHVDSTCTVHKREPDGAGEMVTFTLPPEHAAHVVSKGFVALDGVSLTVVDASADEFRVALIPHTRALVTLGSAAVGYRANLEVDVLAKYVARAMTVMPRETALSRAQLQASGLLDVETEE
ncbi:MAG: riboflavin synthase [Chloroflexota bacterium]|nr:riboflavin synthase [Chloroflexota bacterium]